MFSLLKGKIADKTIAVFAVESGSVTLTVTRFSKQKGDRIIFIDRRAIDALPADSPADNLRKVLAAIENVFSELLSRKSFAHVSKARVLVLLGSAYNISWSDKIIIKKDKPFKINSKLIKDSVEEKFKAGHEGLMIISSHLMSVSMNGYKIKSPMGKSTSFAELEVYVESAPIGALEAISRVIEKHLPHSELRYSTAAFAVAEAIVESTKEKSFILLLPEHNVTEVALVKDGSIMAGASIPFGASTISEKLFPNTIAKEALLKTKRFIEGKMDSASAAAIAPALEEIKNKLTADFQSVLWAMNETVLCPSLVFIGGKSAAAFFLDSWISKSGYASQTFTADCFKVSSFSGMDIVDKKVFTGKSLPFVSAISSNAAKSFSKAFELSKSAIK